MILQTHSWDRADLGMIFRMCRKLNCGAEIGVFAGEMSAYLLRIMPDLHFYLIDPYKKYPVEVYYDVANDDQEIQDARYEYVCKLFGKKKNVEILRLTSEEAAPKIPDGSLDFAYIDANHAYEYVKRDIELWWPKIRDGGMLAGHDYLIPQVATAVANANLSKEFHWLRIADVWVIGKGPDVFKR